MTTARRKISIPLLVVVAVLALVVGTVGTTTVANSAGAITKSKVKKIAAKVVKKAAPTLSVAHATNATNATTATTALGVADGSITGADLSTGLKTFTSARKSCVTGAPLALDGTTFATCTIAAPEVTAAVILTDAVSLTFTLGSEITLPYTSTAGGEMNTMSFLLSPGVITIVRSSADATPPGISTGLGYKYTIVPNSAGAAPTAKPAGAKGSNSSVN
jgi:hypothetical protein